MISKTLLLSNNLQAHSLVQGEGEPLVLIHGVGMQAAAWSPQIDYFSKNYHVIAVDMPGHGQSTALNPEAKLSEFVAWTIELIEKLELGAVNLAGHSMGSLIATGVAATRPDLVKRVAVLNGVYKRTQVAREAVLQRAEALKSGKMDLIGPLQRWFDHSEHEQAIAAQVKTWLEQIELTGYATAYTAFAQGDDVYADDWVNITCPALILTGDKDGNSTPEMARQMASAAQNGQAIILDQQRHMMNLTAPDAVNQAMLNWLNM